LICFNPINLLKAYQSYRKSGGKPYPLLLAGGRGWQLKDFDTYYREMEFTQDVLFTGHLSTEQMAHAIGGAELMLYVSLFEGFGIPILEAMQSGVPVITSNISSMAEVAGSAALLVDPYDVQSISLAIHRLVNEEDLKNQLIRAGIQRAQHYSWKKSADVMWEAIEKVVSGING
jgi:glycosyltransferase involved in cell wall biosynthesis